MKVHKKAEMKISPAPKPKPLRPEELNILRTAMPKIVKVGTIDYTVVPKDMVLLNGVRVFGAIDYVKSEIEMATEDLSIQNQKITMAHETVHAIIDEYDLRDYFPADKDKFEKAVELLARGFVQVTRDNPAFIEFIK